MVFLRENPNIWAHSAFSFSNSAILAFAQAEDIEYNMDGDDHRHVKVVFAETPEGVKITETFDPESENTEEVQHSGWQAILDNFKKHVENYKW